MRTHVISKSYLKVKLKTLFNRVFEDISDEIKEKYGLSDLKFVKVDKLGEMYILFCSFSDGKKMEVLWDKVTSIIASKISNLLETDFERWNVYLFLTTNKRIEPAIQYKIENDTFFCRKVVVRLKDRDFSEHTISDLIDEYILNYDISLPSLDDTARKLYTPKSIVYKMVESHYERGKSDLEKSYDELYKSLKSEWKLK